MLALEAHGVQVTSEELDALSTKASILAEEVSHVGGEFHHTQMVRHLRTRFSVAVAALLTGENPGEVQDVQKEIQAIGELILALARVVSQCSLHCLHTLTLRVSKMWCSKPGQVPKPILLARSNALPPRMRPCQSDVPTHKDLGPKRACIRGIFFAEGDPQDSRTLLGNRGAGSDTYHAQTQVDPLLQAPEEHTLSRPAA